IQTCPDSYTQNRYIHTDTDTDTETQTQRHTQTHRHRHTHTQTQTCAVRAGRSLSVMLLTRLGTEQNINSTAGQRLGAGLAVWPSCFEASACVCMCVCVCVCVCVC